MDFGLSVLIHLVFIAFFDSCWLALNFRFLRSGLIYPALSKSPPFHETVLCCVACWIMEAVYLAGHRQQTDLDSFYEGAWTGALVYVVFNFTELVTNSEWSFKPLVVDILWGTSLLAAASVLTTKIALGYYTN